MNKHYIFEYYQKISNDEIRVGKWVKKAYEKIIEGLENKSFYFDAKKANKAIKFIENFKRPRTT